MRAGFPVPQAFCIPTGVYDRFLEANDLRGRIEETVAQWVDASSDVAQDTLATLRGAIVAGQLDPSLCAAVHAALDRLGHVPVAVRSSATSEDLPDYSFAGQYETILGVCGAPACFDAVKECWASLWTHRAVEYRQRHGFSHLDTKMAVVVQALVSADASGVVFTADPVSGSRDRIVIESCRGLGEALVSGKESPDTFVMSRDDLRVLEEHTASASGEGLHAASLDAETARRVAEMALQVEVLFGVPQDIEWCVRDCKVSLLQSRAITTAVARERSWEDRQVWTNANTGEVLPDVVTPFTWSFVRMLVDILFESLARGMGFSFEGHPVIGVVAGRIYFNCNTMTGMLNRFPGLRKLDLAKVLGGSQRGLRVPDEDVPQLRFSLLKVLVKTPIFIVRVMSRSHAKSTALIEEMRERAHELKRLALDARSEREAVALLDKTAEQMRGFVDGLSLAGSDMLWFTRLDKICRTWLDDATGEFANRLLAGVGNMESADAGLALWQLAVSAQASQGVRSALSVPDDWEAVRTRLSESPEGPAFLDQWDDFMAMHGHHTRGELELYNARWHETPDYILDAVRTYLSAQGEMDLVEARAQRIRERDALEARCRAELRNPLKRAWFGTALVRARRGCVARENIKSGAIQYWAALRSLALALGQSLAERGVIDACEDVFFLDVDEVRRVVEGESGLDVKQVVAARRSEYQVNLGLRPPSVVVGRWNVSMQADEEAAPAGDTLQGLAVCPGTVVGPARVILRADHHTHVLPGEILVAPFTDPGWTPYFLTAAGIVTDQGGILSHGSIVAREYGIPTVVNVGPATRVIRTGQMIRVDGTHGTVTILDAPG